MVAVLPTEAPRRGEGTTLGAGRRGKLLHRLHQEGLLLGV